MEPLEEKKIPRGFYITDPVINQYRNNLITSFWNAPEIINPTTMEKDREELSRMTVEERKFLFNIFYFFLLGDDEVIDYIQTQVSSRVTDRSLLGHENIKIANEEIHSECYSLLLDYLAPLEKEQFILGSFISSHITAKIDWCRSVFKKSAPLSKVFLTMIIMELLFFSTSFSSIFWFKNIKKSLLGVAGLNEMIARDESQHGACYIHVYTQRIVNKLPQHKAHRIISSACDVECSFARTITPTTIGMNPNLLADYAKFVADDICVKLGYEPIYHVQNPFPFMNEFAFERKVDFFKKKSTQYTSFVQEEFVLEN